MHRSTGKAYHTPGGARTVPWYKMPTPMGVAKVTGDEAPCTSRVYISSNGREIVAPVPCGGFAGGTQFDDNNTWQDWFGGP